MTLERSITFREPTAADLDLLEATAAGNVWNDGDGNWFVGYNTGPATEADLPALLPGEGVTQPAELAYELYDDAQWIGATPVGPDAGSQPMILTPAGDAVLERYRPGRLAAIGQAWDDLMTGATERG